ncbi:PTS sugar transporter subunit IIA [Candidatus Sumerlaeota bacterium]|nr:PTS sugar transporter subunit IIA [Candidatus Sumerlaeota bacterium]
MNIHEFMRPEWIVLDDISASNKKDLLEQVVETLTRQGVLKDSTEVLNALMERERLMSTGIKRGYAIPHAFTQQLDKSIVCFVRIPDGIDYQSLDGEPVFIIFLLLGPSEAQGLHLKLLARLARLLSLGELFQLLMSAQTPEEVINIIRQEEAKFQLAKKSSTN